MMLTEKHTTIGEKHENSFFDSGLGGLTVLSEAMKEPPQEDFCFMRTPSMCHMAPKPRKT